MMAGSRRAWATPIWAVWACNAYMASDTSGRRCQDFGRDAGRDVRRQILPFQFRSRRDRFGKAAQQNAQGIFSIGDQTLVKRNGFDGDFGLDLGLVQVYFRHGALFEP